MRRLACSDQKYYNSIVQPIQKNILSEIKRQKPETVVRQHMCGNVDALIEKMAELPVDIYELDFPVDLVKARSRLGPNRTILGNVSTITDLLEGTPEKVYQATKRCHQTCGRFHIAGAGCEVSPATPPGNLRAMLEYAKSHRPDESDCSSTVAVP